MNSKTVLPVCVAVAVVAGAIAAVVVTNNRAAAARAKLAAAESREAAALAEEKKAAKEESAAASRAAAAEAARAKAVEDRGIKEAEAAQAASAAKAAEANRLAKEAEAKAAMAKAEEASELKTAEKAKAETARHEAAKARAEAEAAKAKADAEVQQKTFELELKKRQTEAVIAEAKALELRKLDFETLQRDLLEFKQELDERERALHPDATIYDSSNVTWVAEREADVIGADSNRLFRARTKVAPENDRTLAPATRRLARLERIGGEDLAVGLNISSNNLVKTLSRLYVEALKEDRPIDAAYYLKSIRQYYPNWKPKAGR